MAQSAKSERVNICIVGVHRSLAIRGLSPEEFIQRLASASGNQLRASIMIVGTHPTTDACTRSARFARWFHYATSIMGLTPSMAGQDILVHDGIGPAGALVCLLSRILHKKTIITVHGYWEAERELHPLPRLETLVNRICNKIVLKLADLFVVNDLGLMTCLESKGIPRKKIHLRRVFVDTSRFNQRSVRTSDAKAFRNEHGLPDKYVLYVGYLNACDGADAMCGVVDGVLASRPDTRFVFLGEGPLGTKLRDWIKNGYQDTVYLLSQLPYEQMPLLYYGAQAMVLPSRPPQAGVGRLTLEALSMQVPVVAYDVGEVRLVVRDNLTGCLVNQGDISGLVSGVCSILNDGALRAHMGETGRQLVMEQYSLDTWLRDWVSSIYRVCGIPQQSG